MDNNFLLNGSLVIEVQKTPTFLAPLGDSFGKME